MSMVINHNIPALVASKSVDRTYSRLGRSIERLSTGLRINSGADDPAGLAIRELMRTDIALMDQGKRNATDGISLIQTAEGAMHVIDEKLNRMKELAEQAATGTYTTSQRLIINSEYQAMAAEIDRIAEATEFNGVKLLNGSISTFHEGKGLRIHFGSLNNAAEDYYFINIGDVRATTETGLQVGGDAKGDVWSQPLVSAYGAARLNEVIVPSASAAGTFVYYYNHEGQSEVSAAALQTPSYLAGLYHQQSGSTLQDLINSVNQGTASRVQMNFQDDRISALSLANSAQLNIYLGDEVYQFGSGAANSALVDGQPPTHYIDVTTLAGGDRISDVLGSAVSNQAGGRFSTLASSGRLFVFTRVGGDYDHLSAKDCGVRASAAEQNVTWTNAETWQDHDCSASFGLGGESWARAGYIEHDDRYFFKLEGQGLGDHFDLHIGNASAYTGLNNISAFAAADFVERQDASEGDWAGAHLRTQSHAQEALEAIERAMYRKDNTRADLGAYQNRLSNTVDNLGIMVEELQKSESRISDVDVARETTEYSRNSILAQAGTSMLAQANSLPEMALTLLG